MRKQEQRRRTINVNKLKQHDTGDSPTIGMSKIIGQYAADYISMGETTEERQNYLNCACTAWNIAVLPEHVRDSALHCFVEEYKKENPDIDDAVALMQNTRTLVKKKIQLFPAVKTVIISAVLEQIDDKKYRISVVSTDQSD
jgi:hypothetical protein